MLVVASATPGSSISCFSTAVVHDVPQTMPSTKNVTDSKLAACAPVFATDLEDEAELQPTAQPNATANAVDKQIPVKGFMSFS
jgi:hypothetical protein